MHNNTNKKRLTILGVPIDAITKTEALALINELLNKGGQHHLATPNPEMVLAAQNDEKLHTILNETALNVPDGIGIVWLSRLTKTKLPERVTGVDLLESLCEKSARSTHPSRTDTKIFLLGAADTIAEQTKHILEQRYPGCIIVGTHTGTPHETDDQQTRAIINGANPDMLFVAYGAPAQEHWIHRNLPHLQNVKIAMGVGGAFDMIAGKRKRAPRWMQKTGLEWLARLIQEPRRIKRIYNAVIKFPCAVLREKLRKK